MRSSEFWQYYDSISLPLGARAPTFAKAFEYLDCFSRPLGVVETPCLRPPGSFAQDGCSTAPFDKYTEYHPGTVVYSVDIGAAAVDRCKKSVSARVHLVQGDSDAILKRLADSPLANLLVEVPAERLNDRLGDRQIALVFMGIEGSEYLTLKGMQHFLSKARTLIVEFLPHLLGNVAGVSPEQLVALVAPHFDILFIPSRNQPIRREEFGFVLRAMFDAGDADQGIVFSQ
jgi:hypothetical protein